MWVARRFPVGIGTLLEVGLQVVGGSVTGKILGPFDEFQFFLRKSFLMWVGGWVGHLVLRQPQNAPAPVSKQRSGWDSNGGDLGRSGHLSIGHVLHLVPALGIGPCAIWVKCWCGDGSVRSTTRCHMVRPHLALPQSSVNVPVLLLCRTAKVDKGT